ncbi:MAG: response regulator, partial [Candidatus Methylumidiphilus sp.]
TKPVTPSDLFNALAQSANSNKAIDPTPPQIGSVNSHDFNGARILLVEDNAINQQVAAELLRRRNISVIMANHGAEAIDWMKRESFDAVLMDLHMPVMDGLEATRRIRELPGGANTPIIAMTAAVMPEDRERCAACGMVDFVSKPVDPDELTLALQRWIKPRARPDLTQDRGQSNTDIPNHSVLPNFLPGFDLDQALKRLEGNRNLLSRLLHCFYDEQQAMKSRLDALLDSGQNSEAAMLLHTFRGVAANLGATELAHFARLLELEIKQRAPLASRGQFAEALAGVLGAISTFARPESEKPELSALNQSAVKALLCGMAPYLREREVLPEEQILLLERLAQSDLPDAPLTKLMHQIDQFDYAKAMGTLNQLAVRLGMELPV